MTIEVTAATENTKGRDEKAIINNDFVYYVHINKYNK